MLRILKTLSSRAVDLVVLATRGGVALARRKGVTVGEGCRIYIRHFGSEPFLIKIGDGVTVTSGVRIITHDGSTGLVRDQSGRRYQSYGPVNIGDNVFIGVNSIILPGVTIGSNVVIGAGSVVTRDIEDGMVAVGNPAKVVGSFNTFASRIERDCVNDRELDGIANYRQRVERAIEIATARKARQRR